MYNIMAVWLMRSAKSRWCDQLWKVKESLRKESPHGATGMQLVPIASMRLHADRITLTLRPSGSTSTEVHATGGGRIS